MKNSLSTNIHIQIHTQMHVLVHVPINAHWSYYHMIVHVTYVCGPWAHEMAQCTHVGPCIISQSGPLVPMCSCATVHIHGVCWTHVTHYAHGRLDPMMHMLRPIYGPMVHHEIKWPMYIMGHMCLVYPMYMHIGPL